MNLIGPQQFSLVILGQHRHLHSLMHNMGLRLAQDPVGCAGNIGVFLGEISTLSPKTKTSEISPDSLSFGLSLKQEVTDCEQQKLKTVWAQQV